jgi:hypothetical protein
LSSRNFCVAISRPSLRACLWRLARRSHSALDFRFLRFIAAVTAAMSISFPRDGDGDGDGDGIDARAAAAAAAAAAAGAEEGVGDKHAEADTDDDAECTTALYGRALSGLRLVLLVVPPPPPGFSLECLSPAPTTLMLLAGGSAAIVCA